MAVHQSSGCSTPTQEKLENQQQYYTYESSPRGIAKTQVKAVG